MVRWRWSDVGIGIGIGSRDAGGVAVVGSMRGDGVFWILGGIRRVAVRQWGMDCRGEGEGETEKGYSDRGFEYFCEGLRCAMIIGRPF